MSSIHFPLGQKDESRCDRQQAGRSRRQQKRQYAPPACPHGKGRWRALGRTPDNGASKQCSGYRIGDGPCWLTYCGPDCPRLLCSYLADLDCLPGSGCADPRLVDQRLSPRCRYRLLAISAGRAVAQTGCQSRAASGRACRMPGTLQYRSRHPLNFSAQPIVPESISGWFLVLPAWAGTVSCRTVLLRVYLSDSGGNMMFALCCSGSGYGPNRKCCSLDSSCSRSNISVKPCHHKHYCPPTVRWPGGSGRSSCTGGSLSLHSAQCSRC